MKVGQVGDSCILATSTAKQIGKYPLKKIAPKLTDWFIPEPYVLQAVIRHFDPVEHGWVLSHDQAISF